MFISGSLPPRRLALPAPAPSRAQKTQAVHPAQDRAEDRRTPVQKDRPGRRRSDAPVEPPVARATSQSGVQLQAAFPHPRRGLRADASERARYARAYDSAQALTRPAPQRTQERSA